MSSCSFKDSIIYKSLCVCSEEFAVVAQHSRTSTTLALRLVRHMDATGRPFRLHLARCTRWPQGLDAAIYGTNAGPAFRYCAETLRHTGDINLARQAHAQRQVMYKAPAVPAAPPAQAALPAAMAATPAAAPGFTVPAPQVEYDPWNQWQEETWGQHQ